MCYLLKFYLWLTDSLDLSTLGDVLSDAKHTMKKSPHSFLGENSSLVNLDNLVTVTPKPAAAPATQGINSILPSCLCY